MTEKLKSLMHERAELTEFELPDVELLIRHGAQRARRRRLAQVSGGVAATTAAVVVAAAALSGGPAGDSGPAVATDPLSVEQPSYAKGTVIHDADGVVDVGHRVRAYVRTEVGYVVVDPRGTVWSVAGGDVSKIGSTDADRPRLVSDPEGPLAGWVDASGDRPAFVIFDQSNGDIVRNSDATAPNMGLLADEANPAYLHAIDGDLAYWRDQRGLVSFDLDSEKAVVVDAGVANGFELLGVEGRWLATSAGDHGIELEGDGEWLRLPDVYSSLAAFSPDARWVSFDADQPEVFRSETGVRTQLDHDSWFATGYEWLDADTLVLVAKDGPQDPIDLVTCTVPSGACEVAITDLATDDGYALPVGEVAPGA